jgi:hydroxymethylpyrimidine/phosphomethylpyrimidine kinase
MSRSRRPPSVLSIAGSDSGGGAGIQADLKTFAALGVHGLTAIAAVTAQHTRGVTAVQVLPRRMIRAQLDALFDDFDIRAVKIGMLGTRAVVAEVADALAQHPTVPVVLDPVMVASSGAPLLRPDAIGALRRQLVPRAALITPNLPEAELLLGHPIGRGAAFAAAAAELLSGGARAVLLKGGHAPGRIVLDLFRDRAGTLLPLRHRRLRVDGHGTGCTLSAAIAARLALGDTLPQAVQAASDYVHGALRAATWPGRGAVGVLGHGWALRPH